ncbi:MAG: GDSL-type esterase/lipase family protein [Pseudomonadota bacterium]
MTRTLRGRLRFRSHLARLGMGGLVAGCVLAGLEITARVTGIADEPPPEVKVDQASPLVRHPTRLWAMAPGTYQVDGVQSTIGEDGLRGDPPQLPRPAGRERILLLGDSSWFGFGVADDQTMAAQLGERLRQHGLDAEVINGGVPGYSTEQTRIQLDEQGWGYDPTLLLLGGLWSDSTFDRASDRDLLPATASAHTSLLGRSALARLLARRLDRLGGGVGARVLSWPTSPLVPAAGVRRVPLADYAANLDRMIRAARDRGVGAALLAPGNRHVVAQGPDAPAAWTVYFRVQERVAEHHGIPIVRGWAALRDATPSQGIEALFVDDLHPSAAGQAAVAEAVEAGLKAAGWPAERLLGSAVPLDARTLVDDTPDHLRHGMTENSPFKMLEADTAP